MKTMKIMLALSLLVLLAVGLSGCVPGDGSYTSEAPAGFWWGLWHGIISWITFLMGLFTNGKYTIYESFNTGWPYNLGFLLGVGSSIGSISVGGFRIGSRRK